VSKNTNSQLHPLQKAREYKRALNAAKMEKIFAKPFIKALDRHTDSIQCMARSNEDLTTILTGSCNGEIILWNLATF